MVLFVIWPEIFPEMAKVARVSRNAFVIGFCRLFREPSFQVFVYKLPWRYRLLLVNGKNVSCKPECVTTMHSCESRLTIFN